MGDHRAGFTDTVGVLGLDAADHELANRWDCENLLLDEAAELETFSYTLELPKTTEVWPTMATGVHPREHEVSDSRNIQWDDPFYRFGSLFTQFLPDSTRTKLGDLLTSGSDDMTLSTTDHDHVFDDGAVYEWPGITEAPNFLRAVRWSKDDLTAAELEELVFGQTGKETGWLTEMTRTDLPIVGVQCHILDVAGHTFATDDERLRRYYEYVDRVVGDVRDRIDTLVIVSDHGMQTSFTGDENPGRHSWRAMISAQGTDGELPRSVFEVRDFLEDTKPEPGRDERRIDVDVDEEHLEDLGYI